MVEAYLGIQIIATLFAIFMLYIAFWHLKQRNLSKPEFIFWLLLWSAFIYFALFPKILDPILATLFVVRAMDLLMIIAFMILAFLGFQNHIEVKSLQRKIETLIRKQAFRNARGQ